jgi:CubicO group peptidase (beta-lactamase class C family)
MLKMRPGYPWEETDAALWEAFWPGDYMPLIVHVPLVNDPGAEHNYSNLTSHWLGGIVSRASNSDLRSFAQEHLFSRISGEVGDWTQDADGNYLGHAEIEVTARDMAKFGLLYLGDGEYEGNQIISADWIRISLQRHSEDINSGGVSSSRLGRCFRDIGYGCQWWSARVGDHHFNYATGHGGQLIVLLDELDIVIVATSDPPYGQYGGKAWRHEKAVFSLVGEFINSLPKE